MKDNKCVILFIDQALSFGGSLVVLGDLVGSIDKKRFNPVVVTEVPDDLIDHYIPDDVDKLRVKHVFNYQDRERVKKVITESLLVPGVIKGLASKLVSLVDLGLNSIYLFRLALLMKRYSVDIVHINNGFGNTEAILAARMTGIRVLIHFHGIGKISRISNQLIPHISQFIAISHFVKDSVTNEGVPEEMVKTIHNPVVFHAAGTGQVVQLKAQYAIRDNERIFGIVGRVIPWKGQLEFVKAAILVLQDCPEARAFIVGDKSDGSIDYFNEIKDIVKREGMEDRLIFTGYIKDIHPIYELLDVLVHASIEPEPFGLVITEALSHGTPVVCSDQGATKELVRDGIDGYIVDPFDEKLLAQRILQILLNDSLKNSMARAGKERMAGEFSIERFSQEFESVYDHILLKPVKS